MKINSMIVLFMGLVTLFKCLPSQPGADVSSTSNIKIDESILQECDMYLSFAGDNYSRNEFQTAADHFNTVINLGCGKIKADQLYLWLGISYMNIEKLDSADYAFRNGIKYLPSNKDLIEQAAYTSGRLDDKDQQIYYLEQLINLDSNNNIKHIEKISRILNELERYKEQIRYIEKWLEIDPTSSQAISEKKTAYEKLGKNTIDVDKERWEKEPQNVQFGLSYASALLENYDYIGIIDICNDLLIYNPSNEDVLLQISEAYENLGRIDDAIKSLEKIYMNDTRNNQVPINISSLYQSKEKYMDALEWSNKAIDLDKKNGESYSHRASVYVSIVESCMDGASNSFWSKLVYEMAWEDYTTAYELGFSNAKFQKNNLKDFITTKSDWFMRPENELLVSPKGECYSFIDRKIKRKK